jgi:hypothetical protein
MRCGPPHSRPGRTLQAWYTGGSRARMPAQPRIHQFHTSEYQRPTQLVSFSASKSVTSHRLSGRLPSAASASDFGLPASLSGPRHCSVRNTFERLRAICFPQSHAQDVSTLRRQHPRLTGRRRSGNRAWPESYSTGCCARCKAVLPGDLARSKKKPHESRALQFTILRCFLSFAIVV